MWQKGWHGILIADDMGLGKTLQTLTFIGGLKKFCEINSPILIVAPTALLANWQAEYKKFLRGSIFSEVIPLHGGELRKNLEPLILRRMKEDYLEDLPVKNVYLCREEMPPYQREIYYAVLEKYRRGGFATPLNFIGKLREVSLHPDLGTMTQEKFFELDADKIIRRSARLIKTFELLNQIKTRGEKVLLFVTNIKMQLVLRRLIEDKFAMKILPPINGEMIGELRQKIINEFKKLSGFNALILSPEAAGVGFTITEANNVIHLERTWNPAKENQATDRVYRIGQKKAAFRFGGRLFFIAQAL